ncbi:hypothetical protein RO3G_01508 [Rhizopus delemar RA 99-880]|uniref:Uncharacterized protein n=1 Tax=Rhizopus delemar (strain RA 99-880 / ATCC MYA-4621 / FGSC 9543 / NRRL 43880) TaxID=246409 RepID=I1BKS4_RHIO9|nr:hypothetical protein RO3G_01508 [Rhizopus delemar RA 99-880]|eukprot:EIE76804.1 hypothetical protein RO3G_01508 [Rhizopus delemar RA 99-880]
MASVHVHDIKKFMHESYKMSSGCTLWYSLVVLTTLLNATVLFRYLTGIIKIKSKNLTVLA